LCFKKSGGCGAKWEDGAEEIESQTIGRVENEDIYSQVNTILKMAKKRALVDAALSAGRLSQVFTQDIEDMGLGQIIEVEEKQPPQATKTLATKTDATEDGEIRDPKTLKTITELMKACNEDFKLQPNDVVKELGYNSQSDISETPAECYRKIASTR